MTQKDGESDWQGSQVLMNDMVVSFLGFLFALYSRIELKKLATQICQWSQTNTNKSLFPLAKR